MGQGQPLSQGLFTERQPCLPPSCCTEAPPSKTMQGSPASQSHWVWVLFKVYMVTKKIRWGNQTYDKNQLSTTEPKLQVPKRGRDLHADLSSPARPLGSGPSAGVRLTFAAMTCRCAALLADSPPPLSKGDRERKGEEMTSQDCVPWPAYGSGRE